jgi:hypothetical protein
MICVVYVQHPQWVHSLRDSAAILVGARDHYDMPVEAIAYILGDGFARESAATRRPGTAYTIPGAKKSDGITEHLRWRGMTHNSSKIPSRAVLCEWTG